MIQSPPNEWIQQMGAELSAHEFWETLLTNRSYTYILSLSLPPSFSFFLRSSPNTVERQSYATQESPY